MAAVTEAGDARRRAAEDPKVDREIVFWLPLPRPEMPETAAEDPKVDREIVLAAGARLEMP